MDDLEVYLGTQKFQETSWNLHPDATTWIGNGIMNSVDIEIWTWIFSGIRHVFNGKHLQLQPAQLRKSHERQATWSPESHTHYIHAYVYIIIYNYIYNIHIRIYEGLFFFSGRFFFGGVLILCFPASLIFWFRSFSASLLSLLLCFSFSAFLLLLIAFRLLCFPCFSAFVLLCLSTSTILLFFSSDMCFCCSTSCSSASLLTVFTVSLLFIFFCFIFPVCIRNESLERP